MMEHHVKAELVLHGGERFQGYSFGYEESVAGEVVFATGMVGYPESLTDPSYHGQILVLTSPMVGNYGVPPIEEDLFGVTKYFESTNGQVHVSAVVVQEYCDQPDHWEMHETLGQWLRKNKVPGMMMVDTRSIVLKLRDMGTALGKMIVAGNDVPFMDPNTRNLVAEVSTKTRVTHGHGTLRILVIDMGVKLNTLRCLLKHDVTLIVVPHDWDITTEVYDGLFITNGPGNPQMCASTIRSVRWALQQDKPVFGICMGNQMLCLAAGGSTYKMKYGHRGQNQPCKCTLDGRVVITTQNHGFAVDFKTLPLDEWEEYFINSNDGSNEGLWHKTKPFCSVQFHPEGRCGPQDTEYLFGEYVRRVKESKVKEVAKLKPRKVLVLGAGGIVIAQAGEFDYSGSQCLKSLREEGIETVLINPNIATVQTDDEMADHIYFVPLTVEAVERVIEKERPDGILLGWGGQTALNCGVKLDELGILKKYNVQVLGTPVSVIAVTEDRELFRDTLLQINEQVAKSAAVTSVEEAVVASKEIGFPMMVRAAYCLGGQGSGIVENIEELRHKVEVALAASPQVLLEESVAGWKEIEYEVVRDIYDNCITVCNMENFDPMGIHTGESIVVAPSQTLSNDEFHMLRSASIKIIRHLGIVGECNIQYGLDPFSHRYVVIEVNARLSRSSALASKATGYPLAHVAAKVALGKGLFEVMNGVTKTTMACFEPSMDYIVVKMPRWDLDKFNMVSEDIGSMMKSVGEVMSIGRTFEEALQKAIRMVDPSYTGFSVPVRFSGLDFDYMAHICRPTPYRLFALCRALLDGHSAEELYRVTRITRFFLYKLEKLVCLSKATSTLYANKLSEIPREYLLNMKAHGFSDRQLAQFLSTTAADVRARRVELNMMPLIKQIDTVAGEYPAAQCCYLYSTYNAQRDDVPFTERMYAVLGCGVYRIGNSVEFDYGGVLVARELRRLGNKVILINYNPETVSTDYDECDRLYFDEVSEETVLDILTKERVRGVVISLGGQIVQNMALSLKQSGVPILGTDPANIDMAEDRSKFSKMCDDLGVPQPEWISATSVAQVLEFCDTVGYPALVRPSYVLSGSAMAVIANKEDVTRYLKEASFVSGDHPVVVSKYYEGAMEYDVDIVAHHGRVLCYAICEHVENAGVHSGDATMFLPPQNTDKDTMKRIYDSVNCIAEKLDVVGPMNVQFLLTMEGQLRVIEANVRSSRSVPFVSKTLGISFPAVMVSAFLARKDQNLVPIKRAKMTHIGCKASVFSFNRLAGADPILGVEMASTGEIGVFGRDKHEVFLKAMLCQNFKIPEKGIFFSSDVDSQTEVLCPYIQRLVRRGLKVYCTANTANVLQEYGILCEVLLQRSELPSGDASDSRCLAVYDEEVAKKEKFDLVIQIRDKKRDFVLRRCTRETASPDYWVRRLAVDYNIPLLTEPSIVKMFCECMDLPPSSIEIEPFRHYVPKIYHKIENNNCAMLRRHKVGLMITNNNDSKILALRLSQEGLNITCFHAYLGGSDIDNFEQAFQSLNVPVEVVDLRSEIANSAFDLIMCQSADERHNWHLSKLSWYIFGKYLIPVMRARHMSVVAQTSKQNKKEAGFEKHVQNNCPEMGVYNAWRDARLMEDFATVADQISFLRKQGIKATVKSNIQVHSSVCGNTYYCDDMRSLPAPSLVKLLRDCSATPEFVSLTFRSARCVNINGIDATPLLALQMANEIAGRNGVGITRTREGAMFEAPGMHLLSVSLQFLYDVSFDRSAADLFRIYSRHVSQNIGAGQLSEKHTQSAIEAVRFLTSDVSGVVELELHQGEIIFLKLSHVQNPVNRHAAPQLVTEEELEEVFQPGNGSFSDVQW
ncbi:Carbamoyl-phosphate synthase small chain, CPSase domain/Glutamine amidotransferase class-I/Peptidase C26/Carbamoyl-phosphate synthase L chain, ATP binding domain/ATP-grasp domain/Carbamoyl-phosphate synthetase large chain, oligomerisation domain/D-ala D-ala ligase C-terminus/MGS-like domain/Arginosuccinate synthase, putative [Leishmania lindenbergi]|uniref:Carbamoyl phosphate synthase arginine-specific large chain n=1 Tax=Leishmania lindenbergi TaxID=651832 RepID=A0AAW3AMY8_9TRYP